jgi:nitrogen regulatory protein PII
MVEPPLPENGLRPSLRLMRMAPAMPRGLIAEVAVEAAVLGREDRVAQVRRDGVGRDLAAELLAPPGEDLSVAVEHRDRPARAAVEHGGVGRHLRGVVGDEEPTTMARRWPCGCRSTRRAGRTSRRRRRRAGRRTRAGARAARAARACGRLRGARLIARTPRLPALRHEWRSLAVLAAHCRSCADPARSGEDSRLAGDVDLQCSRAQHPISLRLKIGNDRTIVQKMCICRRNPSPESLPPFLESRRLSPPCCPVNLRGLPPAQRKGMQVKLIIAAIKPFKLEEVREALTSIGVRGMMVTEIKGFGSQSGHTEIYRGAEYAVNFVPKVKLEIVVPADMADQVVQTIATTAKTDKIGDGKIFVLDVESAMRVRTGETNEDAL